MLSVTLGANGGQMPLSPSAQATLCKHLPKLQTKRIMQMATAATASIPQKPQTCDASCLTEVCSSENLPEVEIFSLLEEQIPKYKVRNDFLTSFSGYANEDWFVPAPALPIPVEGLGLTKEQTRECLNYFLKL
ncbi:blast:Trafficking kinesin-binding protein 1 [Drosophila guanche]|uniref:Blast:Trafficking kinesin-binding protein 1 n=1 Tax=Drosophila guanche TaxID=7266 RepID=A0A3B0KTG8_DROGU|nr:blast:Trafficking kinesin-binding protein 1 [Drosophila guanche]